MTGNDLPVELVRLWVGSIILAMLGLVLMARDQHSRDRSTFLYKLGKVFMVPGFVGLAVAVVWSMFWVVTGIINGIAVHMHQPLSLRF